MARPALWMATALSLGIAAAEWLRPHPVLALGALIACGVWCIRSGRRGAIALLAAVAMFGALRYAYVQTAGRGDIGAWRGQKVLIAGTVSTEPEVREPVGVAYTVTVEEVEGHPASGKVHVTQRGGSAPRFGERVQVRGTLKDPQGARVPGGFDQAAYLARQSTYFTVDTGSAKALGPGNLNPLRRAAVAARIHLEGVLKATLPPREAALMAGLLFGSRSELPDDIRQAFKTSGVFHLLAVSGGNVAMIVVPLLAALRRVGLSRRGASGAAIPFVVFFVFLTGAGPSVMRAGLMAVLVLLADVLRREKDAINSLGAAALLLLLWQPGLIFDIGFQLSAGATLGILLFARRFEAWMSPRFQSVFGEKAGAWLASGLSVTFAAQALVEPISLFHFGAFSAIAPLANLMVLTLVEFTVQIGSIAVLVGLALVPVAWLINWLVRLGLFLLVFTTKATASVPGAYLEVGRLPLVWVLVWYGVVAVLAGGRVRQWIRARMHHVMDEWRIASRPQRTLAATLCGVLLATGVTWGLALAGPPDTLTVSFLDVGQGDAIVVEAPGGRTMLIDGGPAAAPDLAKGRSGYDAGEDVVLPYLAARGIGRLDYVVLTHPHQDHVGGIPAVLAEMEAGLVLDPGVAHDAQGYRDTRAIATRKSIPIRRPNAGEVLRLGPDVVLEVLNPPRQPYQGTRSDENSNSIVLRLRYRRISLLLTGDMEEIVEEHLLAKGAPLQADLLKVAHHGSAYSSSPEFLAAVKPRFAVISMGRGNLFGHPDPGTVQRLQQAGAAVYRTDRHGTVIARTDGLTLSLSGTRGQPADEGYRALGILGRRLWHAW